MKRLNTRISVITNTSLAIVLAIVAVVCFFPESSAPMYGGKVKDPLYFVDQGKNAVCITVNVYENADVVKGMADVFEEYGAKATFFVGGCWADDNAETINYLIDKGHEIANHGYFHKDHKKLDYDGNRKEIERTDKVVGELCGVKLKLFAPPSGSFSDVTLEAAYDLGYKVVMWSKDTIDWRDKDKSKIFKRATASVKAGDIILMHPKEHTLEVLPNILSVLVAKGFSLTTVSQAISNEV